MIVNFLARVGWIVLFLLAIADACWGQSVDLAPLIAATPAGGTLSLVKGNYRLDKQCLLTRPIIIHGNQSTLTAPALHDCFTLIAPGCEVGGFICDDANIFCHVQADHCQLYNCTLSGVVNAVKVEAAGTHFVATNVVAKSSSVTFFGVTGFTLKNCSGWSLGEYAVRWEWNDGPPISDGFLIDGGEFSNVGNAFGKQTIGDRIGRGRITGAKIRGPIRIGQQNQPDSTKPGDWATMEIDHCVFVDQSPGHVYLEVMQGADVYEHDNNFLPGKNPNFAVDRGRLTHAAPATSPATKPAK